jgi:hypothetical protein
MKGNVISKHSLQKSKSKSHCDWRSVCLSWCRASAGAHDQMFLRVWKLLSCPCGAPSLTRGRVCHLSVIVGSISPCQYVQIFRSLQLYTLHNNIPRTHNNILLVFASFNTPHHIPLGNFSIGDLSHSHNPNMVYELPSPTNFSVFNSFYQLKA